jgi:hypothetical protein
VNKSLLTEVCAPLSIVSKKPIKKQGGALIFKGLPQDGGWADKKNLLVSHFNKYLSKEPNFSRIHLAEQYLLRPWSHYGRQVINLKDFTKGIMSLLI